MPTGSCLCGAITYLYTGQPIETALCHCNDCQKWSGGGYTSNVIIPRDAFKITKGVPKCFTNIGESGVKHPHFFCGDCGSSIYVQPEAMGDVTVIKSGTLDGEAGNIPITIERFTKYRRDFAAPVHGAIQAESMQRDMFEKTKADLLKKVATETKLRDKATILLEGVKKLRASGEINGNPNISLANIEKYLSQARYDLSVSRKLLQHWQNKLLNELDVHSLKFEYACLCGRLVEECLSVSSPDLRGSSKLDFGFETLAETDMLDQRMKWEALAFAPFPTDTFALQAYLNRLFTLFPVITKAHLKLRQSTAEFERKMNSRKGNHFNDVSMSWVINGLLQSDLLTKEKRKVLKDFQSNKAVLSEIADVLNMRMISIDKWEWDPKGVAIEQRRLLNGRSRFFHDDELLQAMLLRYIGVEWSVHLKAALAEFQSTANVWKTASDPVPALDHKRRKYFLAGLPWVPEASTTRLMEVRGSYDDDGFEDGDTRKSSLQITQALLHTLATEIIIKRALGQDVTVVRTDFASFGPSLPHLTITTVLKTLGVSDRWVDFFRRTLEAAIKFMEDGLNASVHTRMRGTPPSSPMSDFMAEAVLFCLDFSFNQETNGARMYRMHDDIWIWGSEASCTKGWDVMMRFASLTGLGYSREKTGCVKIGKEESQPSRIPSTLPSGDICWGFLKLDATTGRFLVDQDLSVMEYVQAWNIYGVRFFANNIGKPANCFGVAHVHMMLQTFRGIQSQLFGSTEHSATENDTTSDVTSTLQQQIKIKFGVDVPEGYIYFPTSLGGLDLKNPFINLGLIQDTIHPNSQSRMARFFQDEKADYARAIVQFEKVTIPARQKLSKEDLAKDQFANEPFMSFAEFTRYREQTSSLLYKVYKNLMREPVEQRVDSTPGVVEALGRESWGHLTAYQQRVIELHADDIIPRFSGLNIVQQDCLPNGMVSMFRESRFQWKG
ncbi:hypothetical protein DL98DRAFT_587222 [Cadophora sp. DSE1049]|nr:hypothetical protein DL98DRAFT_587222 [Cadophora sp. DSE1049]